MRVPDISVSRLHSQLVFKNDQFYIEDLESKFGTLVLMHRPFIFEKPGTPIKVQVGRSILTLDLIPNKDTSNAPKTCFQKVFSCCTKVADNQKN